MTEFTLVIGIIFGSILTGFLCSVCSVRMLAILQQENYGGKAFLRWYAKKNNLLPRRYSLLALSLLLLLGLFNFCFSFLGYATANLVSALPFVGMFALFFFAEKKYALKVPLKGTGRLIRLAVCYMFVVMAISCGFAFGLAAIAFAIGAEWVFLVRFVPFAAMPLLLPLLLALSNLIMKGYELPRNRRFIAKAKKALAQSSCIKIGITGSCGKTSVKQMAAAILGTKYRVIATPASYNTPIGIARTVNEKGLDCDIFLAEMGARKRGDIAELCDLIAPDYGVVTSVYPQHLETFGSFENIVAEKGELPAKTKGCVIGKTAFEAGMSANGAFIEGKDYFVEDVVCKTDGTQFTLRFSDGSMSVTTELLGRHAAEDIALAAALCRMLGMDASEIAAGIAAIKPVPHRLQRMKGNGLTVLDDSYNSNVAGARNAVEVLRLFNGQKAVITPGLVELGVIEEEENRKLGASFVGLDLVILVGETLVLPVRNGYLEAGGEKDKLVIVPTLERATEKLSSLTGEGNCVLFLNDLPDKY